MKYKFKTKWERNEIICICTLSKKCACSGSCEELEFTIDKYSGIEECMNGKHTYKKINGRMHQIK